jgi:hypothetical protein
MTRLILKIHSPKVLSPRSKYSPTFGLIPKSMLRSILTLTFRKFFKNLSYSFIILSGLVVGLTTAILIFLWVAYELGFDRYHPDNERVFMVLMNETMEDGIETYEETPVPLADYLAHNIPEVESFTRVDNTRDLLSHGTKSLQKYGIYADTGYFQVFHPEMISGNTFHKKSLQT